MLTDKERYLFDLQGYLEIDEVLKPDEVADLNHKIDEYDLWEPPGQDRLFDSWSNGDSQISVGPLHRFARQFRQLVGHPRIVPYLADFLGNQFRYDHGHAMLMRKGGGPFELHGGAVPWLPGIRYEVADGQIHSELLVVAYALGDVGEGDGGLCVVPGSHKSNFACPSSFVSLEETGPWLRHVPQKAGSAIIFTEALTHGTLPWAADHERRALFYRYTPGHMALVGRYREDEREESDGGTLGLHTVLKMTGALKNGASSRPRTCGIVPIRFREVDDHRLSRLFGESPLERSYLSSEVVS